MRSIHLFSSDRITTKSKAAQAARRCEAADFGVPGRERRHDQKRRKQLVDATRGSLACRKEAICAEGLE